MKSLKTMNCIVLIMTLSTPLGLLSQTWTSINRTDNGIIGADYIDINESDSSIFIGGMLHYTQIDKDGDINNNYYLGIGDVLDIETMGEVIWGVSEGSGLFKIVDGFPTFELEIFDDLNFIQKDEDDTLWIGSNMGAGIGFVGHDPATDWFGIYSAGGTPLVSNRVYSVVKDVENRRWLSHWGPDIEGGNGITKIDGDEWKWYNMDNSEIPTVHVIRVVESLDSVIIAATKNGLCRYDEVLDDWIVYNTENTNMPSNYIDDIQFDDSGRTWATFHGVALGYTEDLIDWTIFNAENSPVIFDADFGVSRNEFGIDALGKVWIKDDVNIHVLDADGIVDDVSIVEEERLILKSYPNPTEGFISIHVNQFISGIYIYNSLGKIVFAENDIVEKTSLVDLSNFEKGIYFIQARSESSLAVQRIILN